MHTSRNQNIEPMHPHVDHGSEAFRILDDALLQAEEELEREQQWLEHDRELHPGEIGAVIAWPTMIIIPVLPEAS